MQAPRYGKKTYIALGKLVVQKHPEVADKLLPYCQLTGESDHTLIRNYFKRFCEHLQLNPLEYTGMLKLEEKAKIRRLFIGVMLRLYNSHVFQLPHDGPAILRLGFLKALSESQSVHVSSISRQINKVIFYHKHFPEFRTEIESIANHLNPKTDGKA